MSKRILIVEDDHTLNKGIQIALKKDECGMVCLNSSHEAKSLYQKIGFKTKENYMVMML